MTELAGRLGGSAALPGTRRLVTYPLVAATLASLPACSATDPEDGPVRVFAASSLTVALTELESVFEAGGRRVDLTLNSSSLLARQIERGAPADVFVSADEEWLDHLAERGLIAAEEPRVIARNSLVVVVPSREKQESQTVSERVLTGSLPAELREGHVAVGDPEHVPVGRYARESMESLGWYADMSQRLVTCGSARAVLTYVELGRVDAGIVYATDAQSSRRVRVVGALPVATHREVRYGAAICARGSQDRARAFIEFLSSDLAREVLERHAFVVEG